MSRSERTIAVFLSALVVVGTLTIGTTEASAGPRERLTEIKGKVKALAVKVMFRFGHLIP